MSMMQFAIGLTGLNLILLIILLWVYLQNYLKIKANFNVGLILFALIFAIQKLVSLILFFTMMDHANILGTPMFILEILEAVAFTSLVWVTVK